MNTNSKLGMGFKPFQQFLGHIQLAQMGWYIQWIWSIGLQRYFIHMLNMML